MINVAKCINKIVNSKYRKKQCLLEELVHFKRGINITSYEMVSGNYPVVSAGVSYSGYHNVYNVSGPSITISASGANAGIVKYHNYNFWAADCLYSDRSTNIDFANYFLKFLQSIITNLQRGAAQPHVYAKNVNRLYVEIPENDIQCEITKILVNYDKLIENNNKRIKILEDMAESLYKEWFVRFRFPGYENISMDDGELGKIPVCFKVVKVKEVLDQYIGGGWGNDDFSKDFPIGAYVIRGTDFPSVTIGDVSTCPYRYHKKSNYESRVLKENDIVFEISGGTSEQPVGRAVLIRKGILRQFSNQVICASFCKLLRPNYKLITPNYFYYWLKYLYDTRIIDRYQLQSTGIINFKFEYFLKKGIVLLPPSMYMDLFEKKVKDIKEQIDVLSMQNSKLVQQRDALLPRLMSGKLEVNIDNSNHGKESFGEILTLSQYKQQLLQGMAARASSISENDIKAAYEAYVNDRSKKN